MSNFLIEYTGEWDKKGSKGTSSVKFVFIHIPKTAGMSIRNGVFGGNYEGPIMGYIPQEWKEYPSFAFVRNPFDRLVSAWKMFNRPDYRGLKGIDQISFSRFIAIATDKTLPFETASGSIKEGIRHHTLPQTHPFNCLDQAKQIGRFENLKKDFNKIMRKIGFKETFSLPHKNSTVKLDYRTLFDEESKKKVEKFYKEDLEKLDYEF